MEGNESRIQPLPSLNCTRKTKRNVSFPKHVDEFFSSIPREFCVGDDFAVIVFSSGSVGEFALPGSSYCDMEKHPAAYILRTLNI